MPRNRLTRVMKHCSPTGRRNYGRPLMRLLDTWHRNGSTCGPTPRQIYDDDDEHFSKSLSSQLHTSERLPAWCDSSGRLLQADSETVCCALSCSSTILSLRGHKRWPCNEWKSSGFAPAYKSTSPPAVFIH